MSNQLFNAVDNRRQLQGNHHADHHAAEAAKQTRQQTIPDENGTNKTVFRAQRAQNGNVAALVFNGHHQRRDDVKTGHANHQHHRQIHNGADHLDIAIHIAVGANPAFDIDIVVGHATGVAHQFIRIEDVVDLNGDTGDAVGHIQVLTRIVQRDHRKAMIELTAQG
ncbi:hypothetical protein D3C72_1325100 [compost metagenome]